MKSFINIVKTSAYFVFLFVLALIADPMMYGQGTTNPIPTIALTQPPAPVYTNLSATFSVHVSCNTACGTVRVDVGTANIHPGIPLDSSGNFSYTISPLLITTPGNVTTKLTYSGNSNYQATTALFDTTFVANPNPAPTITLTPPPAPVYTNTSLTFSAHVSCNSACGTVRVDVGSSNIHPGITLDSSGNISYTIPSTLVTSAGNVTTKLTYNGSYSYEATATSFVTTFVTPIPTITLTQPPAPIYTNSSLSFTAHVSCNTACGTVRVDVGPWSINPTVTLDSGGNISYTLWSTQIGAPGDYTTKLTYSGNSNYQATTASFVTTVQANPNPIPTITLTQPPAPVYTNTSLTFSAHVSCNSACGTVRVDVGISNIHPGIPLDSSGNISYTIPPTLVTAAGNVTTKLTYNGNSSYQATATSFATTFVTQTPPTTVLYSYSITQSDGSSSGYDGVGNIIAYDDLVNQRWSVTYDSLNRIKSASQGILLGGRPFQTPTSSTGGTQQYFCWSYDSFGNRKAQVASSATFADLSTCQLQSSADHNETTATYDANNRFTGMLNIAYDGAGNLVQDSINDYFYDGDGRLCATSKRVTGLLTVYIYDAEGNRVGKGTFQGATDGSMPSNPCELSASNQATYHFVLTNQYIPGPEGQQMTELDGVGNWTHTNIFAGGSLIATDDSVGRHYQLNDWLGNRRMQVDAIGNIEAYYQAAPYGDQLNTPPTTTEHYFTGKERDSESGLDYFGARYYASLMGRWMSPDWADKPEAVPYSSLDNPLSLNLYGYVLNNPLSKADPDGHWPDWSKIQSAAGSYATGVAKSVANQVTDAANFVAHYSPGVGESLGVRDIVGNDTSTYQTPQGLGEIVGYTMNVVGNAAATVAGMGETSVRAPESPAVPESIPAGPGARPSPTQQNAINQMGEAHGCSTCGATTPGTKTGNWVGDHQPPTKLNPTGGPQVYKPQCLQCSRQQGGQVAAAVRAAKKIQTPQQ